MAALSAKGDPLEAIDRLVPWESFRADIEAVVLMPDEMRKSNSGRKPVDAIVMFRMLVLQALHNLSDEQAEYQARDRLSFTRFLRLGLEDGIPDATTLWLFREKLAKAGLIEKLFERFDQHLAAQGYLAHGGQMIDATIVPVPKQRNSRDENEAVKAGRAEGRRRLNQRGPTICQRSPAVCWCRRQTSITAAPAMLMHLADSAELFHTATGTAHALDGHRETWPVRGPRFRAWLRRRYPIWSAWLGCHARSPPWHPPALAP